MAHATKHPLLSQSIARTRTGYRLTIRGAHGRLLLQSDHATARDAKHHGLVYREDLAAREHGAHGSTVASALRALLVVLSLVLAAACTAEPETLGERPGYSEDPRPFTPDDAQSPYLVCLAVCTQLEDAGLLRDAGPGEYLVVECVTECETAIGGGR